jgi:RNA polymerase sigma-70 factor (ECF subfamily)
MAPAEACGLVLSTVQRAGSATESAALADLPALPALVEEYAPLLFRVVHSVLRTQADAEDVVQDAFVRVMEHRSTLPAVRDMRVWLVRIAWNLAIDRKRRIRPEQMDDVFVQSLVSRELPADEVLQDARRLGRVLAEIDRLPRMERAALLLSAVEELENAEMAAVLGKSESAVRALLFRARTRLRERLAKRGGR